MSDPKPLSPAETMRAVGRESAEDAVDEVMSLTPAEVDDELRKAGVDPAEAERRATAAIEAALASVAGAAEPARGNVAPRVEPVAHRPARRWYALGAWAAAAATLVALGAMHRGTLVAFFRGAEPIGPDIEPPSSVAAPTEPSPADKALALRTAAFAACEKGRWDACEEHLDDANAFDPAGDTAPEVVAARRAIADGRKEEGEKPKPRLK